MTIVNHYAGAVLDRIAHCRDDAAWLAARLADTTTRLVPVWRDHNLIAMSEGPGGPGSPGGPALCALAVARLAALGETEPILLGVAAGTTYFAVDVSHIEAPDQHPALAGPGGFEDLRRVGPLVGRVDGGIMAYARGIAYWHARHRHCGVCGAPTVSKSAGHARACTNTDCAAQHFPRTDPAVIMLIHDGADRAIFGRSGRFLPGMHSVLAGFLEPGESLEETVAREVYEEVGVRLTDIRYHSSQPWPFPASLMVGFTARATTFELTVDPTELEHAAWYSRSELLASPEDETFCLPRRDSIARRLVDDWLEQG